jgi:hypothetical protein
MRSRMKNDDNTADTSEDQQEPSTLEDMRSRMKNDDNTADTSEDQQEPSTLEDMRPEDDSNSNGNGTGYRKAGSSTVYQLIGIITIIFGVIVGIYLIAAFAEQQQMLFSTSKAELTPEEVFVAVGASLLFIVPGVICIGIGKIIDVLNE